VSGQLHAPAPLSPVKEPLLAARDQISHLYKTTGKIMVLHILIFKLQRGEGKTEDSEQKGSKHFPNLM